MADNLDALARVNVQLSCQSFVSQPKIRNQEHHKAACAVVACLLCQPGARNIL